MARLPGINYQTPVQSLGRQDISGPLRVANAEKAAIDAWGKAALAVNAVFSTNKVAEYSSNMSNQMAELNAVVKNTKNYTPELLDEAGIEYDPTKESIPAHEVSLDYYKARAKAIYDDNISGLDSKGRKVMEQVYAAKYAAGIEDVIAQGIRHGQRQAVIQAETNFEDAIDKGNMEGAKMIADTALINQTWTTDYYKAKMGPAAGRANERGYMMQLDDVDDLVELEEIQDRLLDDVDMTSGQIHALYKSYDSKIKAINKEVEKAIQEADVEASSVAMNDLTGRITEGEDLTATEMNDAIAGFTAPDRKAAMAVWRSGQKGGVGSSNSDSMRDITLAIQGTVIPDGTDSTFMNRRYDVGLRIDELLLEGDITSGDHGILHNKLKAIQMVPLKTPEYLAVEEDVYLALTGGTKAAIEILPGGELAIGLGETLYELNNAALESGPQFDPRKWWEDQRPAIITRAYRKSQLKWDKMIADSYAVSNNGNYDLGATTIKLQSMVEMGDLSIQARNSILDNIAKAWTERERFKAQHEQNREQK